MKKSLIILVLALFLVSSIVLAADNAKIQNAKSSEIKSSVKGLENAILRVNNNETKAHLEEVFAKIQDKRKEQLAKLENMSVEKDEKTNKTIVKGQGNAKFLGFIPTSKNYEYEVDEEGNVKKHPKAFDFMFKKQDPIDTP